MLLSTGSKLTMSSLVDSDIAPYTFHYSAATCPLHTSMSSHDDSNITDHPF